MTRRIHFTLEGSSSEGFQRPIQAWEGPPRLGRAHPGLQGTILFMSGPFQRRDKMVLSMHGKDKFTVNLLLIWISNRKTKVISGLIMEGLKQGITISSFCIPMANCFPIEDEAGILGIPTSLCLIIWIKHKEDSKTVLRNRTFTMIPSNQDV